MNSEKSIILFDGECSFCNKSVVFILNRDKHERFLFASLQSDYAKKILTNSSINHNSETIWLYENSKFYSHSEAALRIANSLGYFWPLVSLFRIIPLRWRDNGYQFFAKNRYKWFGKQEACAIPKPEWRFRFLS